MMPEIPLITTPVFPTPTVIIPDIFEFPTTKSSDVGLVVPMPIMGPYPQLPLEGKSMM